MAYGREELLQILIQTMNKTCDLIEEKEIEEPDLAVVRELAEQLRDELETLADE